MAYITLAKANGLINDSTWSALTDDQKDERLSEASERLDRVAFKTDTASTSYPRFNAGGSPSTPAKGKLVSIAARLALAYAKAEVRASGLSVSDLPVVEKQIKIATIEEREKKSFSSIVFDAPDLPLEIQASLASLARYVHPDFREVSAKRIKYIDGDD